jgi:hypothetical protein
MLDEFADDRGMIRPSGDEQRSALVACYRVNCDAAGKQLVDELFGSVLDSTMQHGISSLVRH